MMVEITCQAYAKQNFPHLKSFWGWVGIAHKCDEHRNDGVVEANKRRSLAIDPAAVLVYDQDLAYTLAKVNGTKDRRRTWRGDGKWKK